MVPYDVKIVAVHGRRGVYLCLVDVEWKRRRRSVKPKASNKKSPSRESRTSDMKDTNTHEYFLYTLKMGTISDKSTI